MKINLLGSSVLLCFNAVTALYPANIGQVQHLDNGKYQFIRRNADQEVKPFNVTLECSGAQCKKVSDTIDKLTNTLSSIIQFKNQIKIQVFFGSYCERTKLCNKTNVLSSDEGFPGEYYTLKNKDGKDIIYPGALYKQLVDPSDLDNFKSTRFFDIILNFNSDIKYWFEADQRDFFTAAAQALVRGLGVDFSINERGPYEFDFFAKLENNTELSTYEKIFTLGYELTSNDPGRDISSLKFNRFILDTLIVTTSDGQSINSLFDPYTEFVFPNHTIPLKELVSYLKKTPLNEASQKIAKLFNTPDSLAIKLPSGNSLAFDTTIKVNETNYYKLFFSESKYLNTKDALMTAKVTKSEARLPSEKLEDWPTYPFGPLLIETLELMGYTLKDSYKNSVNSSESKKDGDKADSKSGNNGSSVKANLSLLAALVSFYLLS